MGEAGGQGAGGCWKNSFNVTKVFLPVAGNSAS